MSVNSYLSNLSANLTLSTDENALVATSIAKIGTGISTYFGADVTEKFIFGSYDRGTILTRKADDQSGVDYMVVFDNSKNDKPVKYMEQLKAFAEIHYVQSEIYQTSPTVILNLNNIKFELVPAYCSHGVYFISDGAGGWVNTNPKASLAEISECDKKNNDMIKPVVRLIKHWNNEKNNREIFSYNIENKITTYMKFSYFSYSSYSEYVRHALTLLKSNRSNPEINYAIGCIDKALAFEKYGLSNAAEDEIAKAFPIVIAKKQKRKRA